jgi:hypothetical protein
MSESTAPRTAVASGALAGLAGGAVMTAFQLVVEMPLSGRSESYEPANLVARLTPIDPSGASARRALNYAAHVGVGVGWGVAHAALARRWKLRGARAGATVFATLWPMDVLGVAALGLHAAPWRWSVRDMVIDVADKFVLAQATAFAFDRLDGPR